MKHDWKPGDLALITEYHDKAIPAVFVEGCREHHYVPQHWHYLIPTSEGPTWASNPRAEARPLVVIDPEDPEQVARIVGRIWPGALRPSSGFTVVQAALREEVNPTPPRIAEPQNDGAVVEDADGVRWVRTSPIVSSHLNDWIRSASATHSGGDRRHWDGIAAVKVLSEGVTS